MNDRNILIKFTAENQGIKDAQADMQYLTTLDESLAKQAAKTAEEFKKQDAAVNQSAKGFAANIGALSNSFANLTKVQIGDVLNKSLADVSKQAGLTGKELINFYANIKKEANTRILGGQAGPDVEALRAVVVQADKALANLGATEEKVTQKTQSFRSRLREVREELAAMEEAGKENTAEFESLQIAAGKLEDQIGDTGNRIRALSSDTFALDAISSGLTGVIGAFTAASAATVLFGNENEDLQKALVKVNAAMALLQGVTSVINVLQKQSSASILVDLLLRRNQAAAATAQAVAEGELAAAITTETVVTEGATVATGALNTVMNLNPAVLLITAIAALAGAMYYFASSEDDANKSTEILNESLLAQLDIQKKVEDATNEAVNQAKRTAENQLAYDQAAHKSKQTILAEELAAANQRSQLAAIDRESNAEGINNIEEYRKKYIDALNAISQAEAQHATGQLSEKGLEKTKKDQQQLVDLNKGLYDKFNGYEEEYFNSNRDLNLKKIEIEQYTNEQVLKSATAYAAARVLLAKAGTAEEFNPRRAANAAQLKEDLANANLSDGERKKLKAAAQKEDEAIDREQAIRILQIAKAGIDDQVILAKEGSKERLDFEIESIEKQKEIDLAAVGLSEKEKSKIRDASRATELEKIRSFNQKVAEDAINTRIANINTELATLQVQGVKDTDEQIIVLKEKLIDEQGRLEIIGIENSVKNEELRKSLIDQVYAKELLAKKQLEKDKQSAEITKEFKPQEDEVQDQIDAINKVVQAAGASAGVIREAHKQTYIFDKQLAQIEEQEDEARLKAGDLTEEEYAKNKRNREKKLADDVLQIKIDHYNHVNEIEQKASDYAKEVGDLLFDNAQKNYDAELQADQNLYDKKLISETEFNNRKKQIAQQQAAAQKEKALFDIGIELAKSIFAIEAQASILGLAPPPIGPILQAKALAQIPALILEAAVESGIVLARKYKGGKIMIDGTGTETSDSIPAMISKNESVINAQATKKHEGALRAINEMRFDQYLLDHEMPRLLDMIGGFRLPALPAGADKLIHGTVSSANNPDNATVLKAVTQLHTAIKELPKAMRKANPGTSVSIDKDGIIAITTDGLTRQIFTNKKLNR